MLTRNRSGAIKHDGRRVDMYRLGDWLLRRELETGRRVKFGEVDEALLSQAEQEDPGILYTEVA